MITIYEYSLLEDQQQIDLLYREGAYLAKRRCGNLQVILYQLDCFYIEVFYSKYRQVIKQLKCFQSTEHLGPYLEQVDIGDLVNILH
ncbi:MAG: hypothetical protein ACM3VS_03450 [Candidatus Dadabacteria bacterium]